MSTSTEARGAAPGLSRGQCAHDAARGGGGAAQRGRPSQSQSAHPVQPHRRGPGLGLSPLSAPSLELLAALAVQGFVALEGRASPPPQIAANPRLVRALVVAYFDFAWREPDLYSLMFEAEVARTESVRAAREAAFQDFEQAIAAAPAAQGREPQTLHQISVAVWTCAHGAASLAPIQEEGGELVEAMISGLEDLFRVGREYRAYPNTVQSG